MSGLIFIISAPSGSGKSTLTERLRSIVPNLQFSVSYTTRPPRGSEESGRHYNFVSRETFEQMIRQGDFLEYADVFGNYYGTPRSVLAEAFAKGNDVWLDIDVQGAAQVKRKLPEATSIFVLPPSREELERRLRQRAEADDEIQRKLRGDGARRFNTKEIIQRRLQTASREIENFCDYDYILVNDRLDPSVDILKAIVKTKRLGQSGEIADPQYRAVVATAERALRPNMMEQVENILKTFVPHTF